jgi:aryl-alcohol dehydrogenase-like predicted oxidoreductase
MKYRNLGKSGVNVSVIGHGTWALGNDFFGEVDEKKGIEAIHAAVDHGVNLIDTAPGYGLNHEAEIAVGKAVKGIRNKVILSTKFGIHRIFGEYVKCLSPVVAKKELENSLTRLQTDYIDIYTIHWPDANFGIEDALEFLARLKKEGKIRAAAVSNFTVDEIKIAEKTADIDCVQPPCSLFDRSSFLNGVIPYCREHNIGILTYGSLGGGILSGAFKKPLEAQGKEQRSGFYSYFREPLWTKCNKIIDVLRQIAENRGVSVAEVSINWVLAQDGVTSALLGTSSATNAALNTKAADWELSTGELDRINNAYNEIIG